MNRRRGDIVVGLLITVVIVIGGALTWQAYQQQRAFDQMGSMMDTSIGTMHGTNPLWYVLGTLLVAALIGVLYLIVRDDLSETETGERSRGATPNSAGEEIAGAQEPDTGPTEAINAEEQPRARVLDLLPEDERRILEPVLSSPGVTQIELRDRSDFSKSKVSQTVSALEKRGLLYRERQGRTYRIYPSDDLRANQT